MRRETMSCQDDGAGPADMEMNGRAGQAGDDMRGGITRIYEDAAGRGAMKLSDRPIRRNKRVLGSAGRGGAGQL